MRILITNDDGINAPGLEVLSEIAHDLAGPEGEVWCVAPAFEQSGVAHCVNFTKPTLITKFGERRYAAEGSPADCVMAGVHHILPQRPDLVLSGVNRGNNAGENALYSGTLGGALEGALQGLPAIALSAYIGDGNRDQIFAASKAHGLDTIREILAIGFEDTPGYGLFWNVNFPPVSAADTKGLKFAPQGYRGAGRMRMVPADTPNQRTFLWISGADQGLRPAGGSDVAFCLDGWISATPMKADFTDHATLARIEDRQG